MQDNATMKREMPVKPDWLKSLVRGKGGRLNKTSGEEERGKKNKKKRNASHAYLGMP